MISAAVLTTLLTRLTRGALKFKKNQIRFSVVVSELTQPTEKIFIQCVTVTHSQPRENCWKQDTAVCDRRNSHRLTNRISEPRSENRAIGPALFRRE